MRLGPFSIAHVTAFSRLRTEEGLHLGADHLLCSLHGVYPVQRGQEGLAVILGQHPGIQDQHRSPVLLAPDQSPETLLELDDRLGHGVAHEGVSAQGGDVLAPRLEDRFGRDPEGKPGDDHQL